MIIIYIFSNGVIGRVWFWAIDCGSIAVQFDMDVWHPTASIWFQTYVMPFCFTTFSKHVLLFRLVFISPSRKELYDMFDMPSLLLRDHGLDLRRNDGPTIILTRKLWRRASNTPPNSFSYEYCSTREVWMNNRPVGDTCSPELTAIKT